MNKRLVSAGLWSFAALYAGSVLHAVAGTPEPLGPAVALTTGALITLNRLARLSAPRTSSRVVAEAPRAVLTGEPI